MYRLCERYDVALDAVPQSSNDSFETFTLGFASVW
jgi:hypothetical protein